MTPPVIGVILAGGRARRMGGGDKCLQQVLGRPLLDHVIDRARPQVSALVLSVNGDPNRFAAFGLDMVVDTVSGFAGPLAGILGAMEWAGRRSPESRWLASFASDSPFFPSDLVQRLQEATTRDDADLACAGSAGRLHPVFGLWSIALADDLRSALAEEEIRKVDVWTARHRLVTVDFPADPYDPFFNVNRPEDLSEAERMARVATITGRAR